MTLLGSGTKLLNSAALPVPRFGLSLAGSPQYRSGTPQARGQTSSIPNGAGSVFAPGTLVYIHSLRGHMKAARVPVLGWFARHADELQLELGVPAALHGLGVVPNVLTAHINTSVSISDI